MPTVSGLNPVSKLSLDGLQTEIWQYALSKVTDLAASLSKFGLLIPYFLKMLNSILRSSNIMKRKFVWCGFLLLLWLSDNKSTVLLADAATPQWSDKNTRNRSERIREKDRIIMWVTHVLSTIRYLLVSTVANYSYQPTANRQCSFAVSCCACFLWATFTHTSTYLHTPHIKSPSGTWERWYSNSNRRAYVFSSDFKKICTEFWYDLFQIPRRGICGTKFFIFRIQTDADSIYLWVSYHGMGCVKLID